MLPALGVTLVRGGSRRNVMNSRLEGLVANGLPGGTPLTTALDKGSAIVELRDYTLRPGQRDVLIGLFEQHFIEGQEAVGMRVIDHFRDLDDPDRFVWLRGFPDMPSRARSLTDFYTGMTWLANRDAANATLVDHENVLLLRPTNPGSGLPIGGKRPPIGATEGPAPLVVATIAHIDRAREASFMAYFDDVVAPELTAAGATILATYVTEPSANTYPRLRIRENEHVAVWFARFRSLAAQERHLADLARSPRWRDEIAPSLASQIAGMPEVRQLVPTARSPMRA
jgi:hypothetical protein